MKPSSDLLHVNTADLAAIRARLIHRLTMLDDTATKTGTVCGTTVWATPDKCAVLYWGWTLTSQGIVVLTNPLAIRSNLLFTEGDRAVPIERQLMEVNKLVHGIQWQEKITGHLKDLRMLKIDEDKVRAPVRRSPSGGRIPQSLPA